MVKRLITTLLVAMAILMALPCAAQSDGGGKKKKRTAKTEQTTSRNTQHKQEKNRRQVEKSGFINGHEWVDLGLSVKWATCNLGATSPGEYGNYYTWGETQPVIKDKAPEDYLDYASGGVYRINRKTQISPTSGHDAAREAWGGTWRMPTESELKELNDKCTWELTVRNGHIGSLITGPNGKSIFLPAAAQAELLFEDDDEPSGRYWSSSLNYPDLNSKYKLQQDPSMYSIALVFDYYDYSIHHEVELSFRTYGFSIRAVTE